MTRVKICGLMNEGDIRCCVQAGVHGLGFVVEYPVNVPWNLTVDKAKELMHKVPPFVSTVAVVGGTSEHILKVAKETRPHIIQLHSTQTLQEVKELAQELNLQGIQVIKALRLDQEGKCDFEIDDPLIAARSLAQTSLSALLVDSYTKSKPVGTGVKVDYSLFRHCKKKAPSR
ncbi:phosphoribosylanthranilate isomerase [Desulfitobacterium sp. PCE1]|uniref:phosphoribosylanthranilate isomerase n=1 Tax=Desulfitobacterium sp. PCE1 TaxID=146907 RepID=UPI000381BBCE|nr:phosphoribosylanthranilate isomerase [Desulfitobacterium sp. PCE1]